MTTAAPEKTEVRRREMIAERQRRSVAWRVIHIFGSLKFALVLLAVIAVACAIATFAESRFDTKVAQAYIYKAPWFFLWLVLLCVNLFAVTLTRWPWQKKHTGFIVTHYGIITLLIGAMIGSHYGFEGNVTVERDKPPVDRIVTSRMVLQIQNPATGAIAIDSFDAEVARPSESRPREFAIPASGWRLRVDGFSESLGWDDRLVPSSAADASPGIALRFSSPVVPDPVVMPLTFTRKGDAMTKDFFGMARVSFTPSIPRRPPITTDETQVVFLRYAPVVQSLDGGQTGVHLAFRTDGNTVDALLPSGRRAQLNRTTDLGQPREVGDGTTVTLLEYWPDFVMRDGRPTTASDQPNNPAVLARVTAPRQLGEGEAAIPALELSPTAAGIDYVLSRGGYLVSSGTLKAGETIETGWGQWTATLTESLPKASIDSTRRPSPDGTPGAHGFRARLVAPDGRAGDPKWVGMGDSTVFRDGNIEARIGYGLELKKVDFTVALKNFEIPRMEGTDDPSNWIATVEFRDPATGRTVQDTAKMNKPASWPGGAWAITTGLNYKFSQAEWNPQNLNETTLQVLYDPGWFFKWVGSLAICAGIFIMFYIRPARP